MLITLLQQAPAETTRYMLAGYSVMFGVLFIYLISLIVRTRNLKRDLEILNELEQKEK